MTVWVGEEVNVLSADDFVGVKNAAPTHELPVLEGPPDIGRVAALAAENGIDILSPPGVLPTEPPAAEPAT